MSDDTVRSGAVPFSLDADVALPEEDLRNLFPRTVRPAVIRGLWVLLTGLLALFVFLALEYSRLAG